MKTAKDYKKFFYILFFFPTLLLAQNAIVGSGFSTGWDNAPCGNSLNFKYLDSSGFGGTYILTTAASGTGNRYFRFGINWSSSQYSVSGAGNAGQDNSVFPNTAYTVNGTCDNTGSMIYNVASTSYNYVFKTSAAGTAVGGNKFVFFEIQGAVRTINAVNRDITSVSSSQSPTITANLDGSLSTGQSVYLRYSTDNFATSSIQQMTGSGTTFTATIPTVAPGLTVRYYVFTSGNNLTISHADADLFTINGNTNGGSNYSYTISAAYQSRQTGLWSDFKTWQKHYGTSWVDATSGEVPSSADGVVTIQNGHIVTINSNLNIDQTTINQGGKLVLVSGNLTVENGIGTDLIISGTYERTSTSTTMTTNGTVDCESTGVYEHNVGGGSLPSITWKDGSILKIKNSLQTNLNQSFWDVLVENGNASSITFNDNTSNTMTVRNDFNLSGGNFYLKNGGTVGGTHTIRVKGNFIQSGGSFAWNSSSLDNTSIVKIEVEKDLIISGGTWSGFVSTTLCDCGVFFLGNGVEQTYSTILVHDNSGTVRNRFYYKTTSGPTALHEIYNGTSAQFTINGACGNLSGYTSWPSTASLLKTVTINNPAGVTLQSTKSVGTTLFLKNGLFNLNSQSFTMTNDSTIDRTGGTISATPAGTSFNVLYSQHTAGFTTDLELPNTTAELNNLTINNGNTITLQNNQTVNGNLSIAAGVFDIVDKTINRVNIGGTLSINDSAKLKIGGTNSFPMNYTTHDINDNSIVEYAGSSQILASTSKTNDYDYGFLELSGSGTKTLGGGVDVYNDLTINGGNLLVNNGEILRVRNEFKNISGTATFENNASLIQENNVSNSGNITYKRIAQQRRLDYVYWSSPVNSFNLSDHSSDGYKYLWNTIVNNSNGTQGNWQPASGNMNAAQGYIISGPSSFNNTANQNLEVPFIGVPRNGDYPVTIYRGNYTGANYTLLAPSNAMVTNLDDNWNLLGNPYPSAISCRGFLSNNSTHLTGALYIWTHGTLPSTSAANPFYNTFFSNYNATTDYVPFNLTGNLANPNPDYYIGAGQGFFVTMKDETAGSATINFTNSLRNKTYVNATGTNFFKSSEVSTQENNEVPEFNRIWIDLVKENQPPMRTLFGYVSGATMQKDNLHDAISKRDDSLKIYSLQNNESFVIQGRSLPFEENDQVAIGVDIIESGIYKIALAMVDGVFSNPSQNIYLEDKFLNIIYNLRQNPYSFYSLAGAFNDRFVIRYTNTSLSNPNFETLESSVILAANHGEMTVKSYLDNIDEVTVYDILSRQLFFTKGINSNYFVTSSITMSQQTLIVKIKLQNGVVVYRKIIF